MHKKIKSVFLLTALALMLSACSKEEPKPAPLKLVKVFVLGDSPEGAASDKESAPFRDPSALSFDAAGRVMSVLIKPGDQVLAGQALVRLDPRDLALSESAARTQFLAAQAELAAAEADFRRYSELHAKGFISAAEHDRRRAQIELARARFEASSDQLGYVTLRSLEAGVVKSVGVKEGQSIESRQIVVAIDLAARSQKGINAKADRGLRIPIGALIDVVTEGGAGAPARPAGVMQGGFVYRIQEAPDGTGTLERTAIKIGSIDERSAQVLSGLSRGEKIVAAGTHVLSPQERVRLK